LDGLLEILLLDNGLLDPLLLDNGLLDLDRVGTGDLNGNLDIDETLDVDGLRDRDTDLSDGFNRNWDLAGDTHRDINPHLDGDTDFNGDVDDALDGVRARDTHRDINITFNLDGYGYSDLDLDRDGDIDVDGDSDGDIDGNLNRSGRNFNYLFDGVRDVDGDLDFSGYGNGDINGDFDIDNVVHFNVVRSVDGDLNGDGDVDGNLDRDRDADGLFDRVRAGNGLRNVNGNRAVDVDGNVGDNLVVLRNNLDDLSLNRDRAGYLNRDIDGITANIHLAFLVDNLGNVVGDNLFHGVGDGDGDVNI
jgi:hypothetical protein